MDELATNPEIVQKQLSRLLPELLTSAKINRHLFKIWYFEF